MSTTEARAQYSTIIVALSDLVMLQQTDKQCDDDVLPRDPVMQKVLTIRQAADELLRAALAAAAPSPQPADLGEPGAYDSPEYLRGKWAGMLAHARMLGNERISLDIEFVAATARALAAPTAQPEHYRLQFLMQLKYSQVLGARLREKLQAEFKRAGGERPEFAAQVVMDELWGIAKGQFDACTLNGLTASETAETASVVPDDDQPEYTDSDFGFLVEKLHEVADERKQGEVPAEPSAAVPPPHVKSVLAARCETALDSIEALLGGRNGPSIQLRAWVRELSTVDGGPPARDAGLSLTHTQLHDIIGEHLTAAYACTRVWDAWSVGTMSQDDFTPLAETDFQDELADAILAAAQEKRTGEAT